MSELQTVYENSFFCDACGKSFQEPLDHFDFGESKKMAIEIGRVKHKCIFCGKTRKLEQTVFREFIVGMDVFVKNEPKTVGHLAGRNTDKVGRAKREDKRFEYQQKRRNAAKKTAEMSGGKLIERDPNFKPWWRDGTIPGVKKYDKATDLPAIKDQAKFIQTGDNT